MEDGLGKTLEADERRKDKSDGGDGISKKQAFENLLRDLEIAVKDIKGLAVITKNGLPVAADLPRDVDIETFSGMSAATYIAAETTMLELRHGHVYSVYTEMEDYTLVVFDAGPLALIVALLESGSNIGLVRMKLKGSVDKVKELMG